MWLLRWGILVAMFVREGEVFVSITHCRVRQKLSRMVYSGD